MPTDVFTSTSPKPDGFEDVLRFPAGGDPFGCLDEPAADDSMYFEGTGATAEIEIGWRVFVCTPDSIGDVSADDWQVIGPDGKPARRPLSNKPFGWDWPAQPGDTPGTYRFSLPAHPDLGELVLTLRLASQPGVVLLLPPDTEATAYIHCHTGSARGAVVGMFGDTHADVYVYAQSGRANSGRYLLYKYETSFPVAIDAATGQGFFELDLRQFDSSRSYALTISGATTSIFQNGGVILCQPGWVPV